MEDAYTDALGTLMDTWRADPDRREREADFEELTGLAPGSERGVPAGWLAAAREDPPSGAPYHRELGLPLAVTRKEDGKHLVLVPAMELRLQGDAGGPACHRVRTGYALYETVMSLRPTEDGDARGLERPAVEALRSARGGEFPDPVPEAVPLSLLLGRRLAHGLTPEDRGPLPPPPGPPPGLQDPTPRLAGAPVSPNFPGPPPIPVKPPGPAGPPIPVKPPDPPPGDD
jgi:hypothetical protein